MLPMSMRAAVSAQALALAAFSAPALAQTSDQPEAGPMVSPFAETEEDPQQRDVVVVTGGRAAQEQQPSTSVTKTAEEIAVTTSVLNAEDSLRYFPNILVRKRHVGDTQAPITTRTSGVGASARSLVFSDGVLLSALIGNNNSNASPKWGMVSSVEIASVKVLYGPFSAAYAGNSIGAVVEIETRMPEKFEGLVSLSGSVQDFEQYGHQNEYGAWQGAAAIGNRFGPLSFWLSGTRTVSDSHPLSYITATQPTCSPPAITTGCPGLSATAVTGALMDVNRTGAPIAILGAGGLERQEQDNLKAKAEWEFSEDTRVSYSIGRFTNDTRAKADSFLLDSTGATHWSGPTNINGLLYNIAPSAFSNATYMVDEEHWSHSASFDHRTADRVWEWRLSASSYDYATSEQRLPSVSAPQAASGGAGSISRMDGTNWKTADADGIWRPDGEDGAHEIGFGVHGDRYELTNERFNTSDWIDGSPGSLATSARGKTQVLGVWLQDAWSITDELRLIAGGRWEWWKAYDGFNYSASTPPAASALPIVQPEVEANTFSPKASLEWDFAADWSVKASFGKAYRFPTVGELYQLVTAGSTVVSPNPNLKPENALSTEFSLARDFDDGEVRVSVFTEDLEYAIVSQTAQLPGSTQIATFIQNIDKVESRGVELVADKEDVLIPGLSLTGSLTYVESTTVENDAFPAAVGKRTPQVPEWRANLIATYSPNDDWAVTLAGRYVDDVFGTIDNSDRFSHTFQGFEGFMVWDIRVKWDVDDHWTAAIGVENLGDADYFLFHPFPQRTATAELEYRF